MGGIIDDKGRISGTRWNVVDFLAVLFLLCLLPIFWFAYELTTRSVEVEPEPPTITLDKVEYEKDKRRREKLDNWLIENKRARKYFE